MKTTFLVIQALARAVQQSAAYAYTELPGYPCLAAELGQTACEIDGGLKVSSGPRTQ